MNDQKYAIAGIHNFGRGLIRRSEITGADTAYTTLYRISAGQVVISKINIWDGAIAFVDESFDGTHVSREYPVFNINTDEHDPRYISHLVVWPELWKRLASNGSTGQRRRINVEAFLSITMPLPSLEEQRRVAAKLDVIMSKLTDVSRLRGDVQTSFEALRESLIARAENPVMQTVESVMELKRRPVPVESNEVYRQIGIRSFGRGVFDKPSTIGKDLGTKKIFSIEPGDLLLSSVFAWEGAVASATEGERGKVGSHRFRTYVVHEKAADTNYLRFFFLSAPGLEVLRRCSPGGAGRNRNLGVKMFNAVQIPLPLLSEQQRIARILLAAEQTALHSAECERRAEACRASLLATAFSGKLR